MAQLTLRERVERAVLQMPEGFTFRASELVEHIGGRAVCTHSMGCILRSMDAVRYVPDKPNSKTAGSGTWVRV